MNKIIGYVLTIAGAVGIAAWSIPEFKALLKLPAQVTDQILGIASVALALVGIFLIIKSGGRRTKRSEVPIYHGKNIVGYRRH